MSYDDLNSVLDVTTKTSQNTGQSVDDLMQKAIDGAPQIKQLGLSFGEGVTLMGQFEQAGVDSSAALSSLSKATVTYAKDLENCKIKLKMQAQKLKQLMQPPKFLVTKAVLEWLMQLKGGLLI